MEELFVLFMIPCACGTNLQVHGQHFVGAGMWQQRQYVACPKCGKEHDLPTRPLRFFFQDGNSWKVSFLEPSA